MSRFSWRQVAARHRIDLLLFAFTLFAYALSSAGMLAHQSAAPQFVYQADAFLHGQLHLIAAPPNLNDWVREGDRWYVSFPPFPAVLMMPFVALAGLRFNDVAFTLVFGALNVALLYRLLRRLQEKEGGTRSEWQHAVFALAYGFGTLAWSCAIRGEVWFTAETVGVTLTLLYLHAAHRAQHPVLAGAAVACAAITRTPLAFSAVFFLFEATLDGRRATRAQLREAFGNGEARALLVRRLLLFALPIAAIGVPMAWANYVRFGSPTEFGHSHLYANRVNAQIRQYGLFHYQFLERNLHAAFTRLPELSFHPLRVGYNAEGMSLFITTPLFLYLLWPREKPRLHALLWLTVAVVAVPGFFYQNSGWQQFGFRFSLDYTPYLVVLLAIGQRPMSRLFQAALAASIAVNAWGAAVFNRFA